MADVYRHAASVLLFRHADEGVEVLLLHKPRKKDSWQLPQGGCEAGETSKEAALRELQEEAGLTGVTYLGESKEVYQYDFPQTFRRFRPDNVCGQRIEFVFALAKEGDDVKVDQKEIDQAVWVKPEQIKQYIKRREYLQLVQRLLPEGLALIP